MFPEMITYKVLIDFVQTSFHLLFFSCIHIKLNVDSQDFCFSFLCVILRLNDCIFLLVFSKSATCVYVYRIHSCFCGICQWTRSCRFAGVHLVGPLHSVLEANHLIGTAFAQWALSNLHQACETFQSSPH